MVFEFSDKDDDFSKSIYAWLAEYDEGDDFLCKTVSNSLPEFAKEE